MVMAAQAPEQVLTIMNRWLAQRDCHRNFVSFSSIGASSCRLSRTMMILGQATGTAAAHFDSDMHQTDVEILHKHLRKDGVALDLETGYVDAMADILEAKT